MEPGTLAKAVYPFLDPAENELALEVGSVVQVIRQIDRYWTYGCCLGEFGNFPTDFVTKISQPSFEPGQKIFVAMVPFMTEVPGDLALNKSDVIVGMKPIDANWWHGKVDNRTGIFPLNIVWEVDMSLIQTKCTEKKPLKLRARVNMDLKAQLDEEIDLTKGNIVTILEIIDKNWYRGESNGKIGIFPSSFVTLTEDVEELSAPHMPDLLTFGNDCNKRSGSDLSVFDPLLNNKMPVNSMLSESINGSNPILVESLSRSVEADLILMQNNSENANLKPCCKTLYPFRDLASDSLEFDSGEVIHLLRRIGDGQWLEGELRGKVGMFPACYVEIIIDLPKQQSKWSSLIENLRDLTSPNDENDCKSGMDEAICLYNFQPQEKEDVSLHEGERVHIIRKVDVNWFMVRNTLGECGLCPANYLQLIHDVKSSTKRDIEPHISQPNLSLPKFVAQSQHEPDLWCDSEKFSGSVTLGQQAVVTATNNSTSLSQSEVNGITTLDCWNIHKTSSKSLYTTDFSSLTSVNSLNGSSSLKSCARRSSCPTSSQVKSATPPSRPPPPVFSNGKSASSQVNINPQDRPRVPLRSAPPVPNNSHRSASVAASVHVWQRYRRQKVTNSGRNTRTMSDASNKLATPLSNNVCGLQDDDIKLEPSQLRRKPASRSDSDVSVGESKGKGKNMVLDELLITERTYVEDLRFCMNAFLPKSEEAKLKGINVELLFGHLEPVLSVNTRLLKSLEEALTATSPEEQLSIIGKCFKESAAIIKKTYADYCANHNEVINLLEKYEENSDIIAYIRSILGNEQDPKYFDLSSILIKPVQRVLKYPLLLRGLIKVAEKEGYHSSAADLKAALDAMTDVATEVNESKRKKDLVLKYRKESDGGLSAKISKLTIHSMKKKSQRIGMRLSSSLGLVHVTKDFVFDEEEQKFRDTERAVKQLLKNAEDFCSYLEACVDVKFQLGEHIADFYAELRTRNDIDNFRTVQRIIKTQVWPDFKAAVDTKFFTPLNALLHLYEGPNKLIEKRIDKLLDYDAASQKLERNKDISKGKQYREDLETTKKDYTALNSQLLEELPKLTDASIVIIIHCVGSFLAARKRYIGQTTSHLFSLGEQVPNLAPKEGDILSIFNTKHDQIVTWMRANDVVTKEVQSSPSPRIERHKKDKEYRSGSINETSTGSLNKNQQGSSQKAYLQGRYPDRLFIATASFDPTGELELALNVGETVAVLKQNDPMGNPLHWFVDNGIQKGFVPSHVLAPIQMNAPAIRIHPPPSELKARAEDGMGHQAHRYEMVAEDDELLQPVYGSLDNEEHNYEAIDGYRYDLPSDSTSITEQSHHQYQDIGKEIPTDSFLNTFDALPSYVDQNSQDLASSPSVTQIDGKVSTPEVTSAPEYYYAGFSFEATSQHEMTLAEGQVILVHHKKDLEGNPEWWFVENRYGNLGYVPASYLLPYQQQ